MTWNFTVSGSLYEDRDLMKEVTQFSDFRSVLFDLDDKIRSRKKWGEVSEEEYRFLDELHSIIARIELH